MSENSNDLPKLKFNWGNAKLEKYVAHFALPSGWTCPGARECMTRANPDTGNITDGPHQTHRCYAASEEARYRNVRDGRWHNRKLLHEAAKQNGTLGIEALILRSLPKAQILRKHTGGDYYSQDYFDAWLRVAQAHPKTRFYAYTKSTHFVLHRAAEVKATENFVITGSRGGEFESATDILLEAGIIGEAVVVGHPDEAAALGLEIDHDDSHAQEGPMSFALLLHGTQPKGTPAAAALQVLRRDNIRHSYPG